MSENSRAPLKVEAIAEASPEARQPARERLEVGQPWRSSDPAAEEKPLGLLGWLLIALRAPILIVVVFGGLLLLLLLRLIERPIWGLQRPLTPWITVAVCKIALAIIGLRHEVVGQPMRGRGAIVANHVSWLDIFTLNAAIPIYFVAKSEVARWPGIGWLAQATGTLFIRRDAREARAQTELMEARLRAGHRLCFFPEGTSTDGIRVLPFKPTLFAAFFLPGLAGILRIQPVSLAYLATEGRDPRFYGWYDEASFASHLMRMLGTLRHGKVRVVFHEPVAVEDFPGRKELSRHSEAEVRQGLGANLPEGRMR